MARNSEFERALYSIRRKIYYLANERTRKTAASLTERLAKLFSDRMKMRLLRDSSPQDDNSIQLVKNLADSIHYRQVKSGYWSVAIPADREGLFLFLEFGTGLTGENELVRFDENGGTAADVKKWASSSGWNYAGDRDNYYKGGWFFRYDKAFRPSHFSEKSQLPYLDESDIYPLTHEKKSTSNKKNSTHTVERYYRKGKNGQVYFVKSYTRTQTPRTDSKLRTNQRNNKVFSKGIYPTRYIYDTFVEIKAIVDELVKEGDHSHAFEMIEQLERSTKI